MSRKHRNLLKGSDLEGRRDTEGGETTPPPPAPAPIGKRLVLRPPPWDKSAAEAEPGSFGHWLRRQRELREISLRDIADRTKISLRYLEAMEEDRFDLLPAPVFAKGFLREYARYVGLSPDEVVNHWLSVQTSAEDEHPADGSPAAVRPFRADSSGRSGPADRSGFGDRGRRPDGSWVVRGLIVFGLLVALALVAGAIYYTLEHRGGRSTSRGESGSPAAAAPSRPAPAATGVPGATRGIGSGPLQPSPAASVPSAAGLPPPARTLPAPRAANAPPAAGEPGAAPSGEPSPLEVTLDFTRDCWVEAAVDGKKWISEERVPGEALQLSAQSKVVLTLGNPSAVEALVNGYSFGLPPGRQPVHDLVIDLDTLRALKNKHEAL